MDPSESPSPAPGQRKSPPSNTPTAGSTPPYVPGDKLSPPALLPSTVYDGTPSKASEDFMVGSPLKKARASLPGVDEESLRAKFGLGMSADVLGAIEQDNSAGATNVGPVAQDRPGFGSSAPGSSIFGAQLGMQDPDKAVKTEDMEEEL